MKSNQDLVAEGRALVALGSGTALVRDLADALEKSEAGAAVMRSALEFYAHVSVATGYFEVIEDQGRRARTALSSTAGAEMLERLEEWKQRTRIEEGHVRMHLEIRRAAEAERDRLAAELAEAKHDVQLWKAQAAQETAALAMVARDREKAEARLTLDAPIAKAAREYQRRFDSPTFSIREGVEARDALLDLCRAQVGGG